MVESPQFFTLGGAALVVLHEHLPLHEFGHVCRICRHFVTFQRESWLLWLRLLEREAPMHAERLVKKTSNKQNVQVWRGALIGHVRHASQQVRTYGSVDLQAAQKQLAAADQDAPGYLAGTLFDPLLPPRGSLAVKLEESWEKGGVDSPSFLVCRDALQLLRRGVPWNKKWAAPRGLLEFLAVTCATSQVVDAILDIIPLADFPQDAIVAGLFESVRCHRHHLLTRLLDSLSNLPCDPRLVAIACYAKNVVGLQSLLRRSADPNAQDLQEYPIDDEYAFFPTGGKSSPLCLCVRGRSRLPADVWAAAPELLKRLLDAGATIDNNDPLLSLLSQGHRNSAHEVADRAWLKAFAAITKKRGCPIGTHWIRAAARPEYVLALLDSGMLPAAASTECDVWGVSTMSYVALRAQGCVGDDWNPLLIRLFSESGKDADSILTQIIDMQQFLPIVPLASRDCIWPCPLLAAALRCKDDSLIERCLTQSTIDAYTAWKCQILQQDSSNSFSFQSESLVYRVCLAGAKTMEKALQRGCRFSQADRLRCHLAVPTTFGPLASLALAAAECGDDGMQAEFARVAILLLELGGDDAEALIYQNGIAGGFAALLALTVPGGYLDGLKELWLGPVREWLSSKAPSGYPTQDGC